VPRAFLIDTDTASDDAVALIMALRAPDVRVVAITTVADNVPVQQSTRNALYTVELCGANVPVYAGADKPLLRTYENATWFHGRDGLGDHNYPAPQRSQEKAYAVDAIIETVEANPGLVIVTLAPLTNLALAVAKKPSIAAKVSRCVIMGGAPCCEGNVTPAAEYNIWVDPEAARMVMLSGLPVELVGWQTSRKPQSPWLPNCASLLLEIQSPLKRGTCPFFETASRISISPSYPGCGMAPCISQWTDEYRDEHTRTAIVRGGAAYQPLGSIWYFPQTYRLDEHQKYLLMSPGRDRAGMIGFRCMVDAE
jgi:hypothetical protein